MRVFLSVFLSLSACMRVLTEDAVTERRLDIGRTNYTLCMKLTRDWAVGRALRVESSGNQEGMLGVRLDAPGPALSSLRQRGPAALPSRKAGERCF